MRSLLPYVDMIKISDEETELLTDYQDPEQAARKLYRQGIKIVAITLGGEGAYVYCKEGGRKVSGFKSRVVDTNGAGDSIWGGFLYRISKMEKSLDDLGLDELEEIARFGNAVASLCVEKRGAIPAMPNLQQVEERLV